MAKLTTEKPTRPRATLEIVGNPGEGVRVFPETRLDLPAAPIFEGEFPGEGRLRLRVPRTSLLVVVSGFGEAAVQFADGQTFARLDARPPDAGE